MLFALTVVLAVAAILGFAALFGFGLIQTWQKRTPPPPEYSDAYLYVSTAIAALVGGIVAVAFGVEPPKPTLWVTDWNQGLIGLYALIYIILGVGAAATWVAKSDVTPPLVKNLATTFLGLAIPIVSTFFRANR